MRRFTCYAVAIGFFTGCSGGPVSTVPQNASELAHVFSPYAALSINTRARLYASDGDKGFIYVYKEFGAHQAPLRQFGPFSSPSSLATDTAGNLYIPDWGTGAYDGRVFVVAFGSSKPFLTLDDSGALPNDLTVDAAGTVYVANGYDQHGCGGGGDVRVFAKGATSAEYTICDTVLGQNYSQVNGVALDTAGNVFVTWESNTGRVGRVREFTGGRNFKGHFLPPVFKYPYAVAIDSAGNVVVSDVRAPAVEVFAPGAKTPKYTFAQTGDPLHIAFDASGKHLFVADAIANEIDEYAYPAGTIVNTINFPGSQLDGIAVSPIP